MSVLQQQDPRFRGLGLKVGLFIALAVLIAAALLLGLAVRQGYFAVKTPVHFEAASGQDLRPGMAVKLSGFKIGEVSKVELNEAARVDVEMQIEDRYMKWVKADSVATLAREGMIGDSIIGLSAGNPALPPLQKHEMLRFEAGRGIADIALDVRNRVVPVIDELHHFLNYANDPKGDLRQGIGQFRQLTAELRQTRKHIDSSIASLDQLQKEDGRQTLGQARQTLAQADATLQHLDQQLPALVQQANQSLQKLDQASAAAAQAAQKADTALSDARPRVNQLLEQSQGLVTDSRAAINAARTRWPFSGGVAAPAATLRPAETTSP